MNKETPLEKIIEVLQWQFENKANYTVVSRKFGVHRKTVAAWTNKYNLKDLREQYVAKTEVGTKIQTVERILPEGVVKEAEEALRSITTFTADAAYIIQKWVADRKEIVDRSGIKALKVPELDRLLRITKDQATNILPDMTKTTETTSSALTEFKKEIEQRNQQSIEDGTEEK